MKIGIVGSGYVGLVTAIMLTQYNYQIYVCDTDHKKIETLSSGKLIIHEPGLDDIFQKTLKSGAITFSTNYQHLKNCDAVFVCVGTPQTADGSANLDYVKDAVWSIAKNLPDDAIIIIKSTVPPGTTNMLQQALFDSGSNHRVVNNPEFLREGSAVNDFLVPDRLVFGAYDNTSFELLKKIYNEQIASGIPGICTDPTSSEMIKYCSNSFLAIKLAFINEMCDLCEKVGADIDDLSEGIGLDQRIGKLFLKPGPGYGGSCFPKDTNALSYLAKQVACPSDILQAAINSNLTRYSKMRDKIVSIMGERKNLAVFGLSFKANTDDVRESPAIEILKLLVDVGYNITAYDPISIENFLNLGISSIKTANSPEECCVNKDGIVILTEWEEFSKIDWKKLSSVMKNKVIIDLRKIVDATAAKSAGYEYFTIGKKHTNSN